MTSDFFLQEADDWRSEAWRIMRRRSDVKFFLLTKRPQRVRQCLPADWGDGWASKAPDPAAIADAILGDPKAAQLVARSKHGEDEMEKDEKLNSIENLDRY